LFTTVSRWTDRERTLASAITGRWLTLTMAWSIMCVRSELLTIHARDISEPQMF
jgi:hypothetical protein